MVSTKVGASECTDTVFPNDSGLGSRRLLGPDLNGKGLPAVVIIEQPTAVGGIHEGNNRVSPSAARGAGHHYLTVGNRD